eukprot:TRINITY_DN2170_c0_g1_i2.p1 TRINITY_DN2170_c0_g1~~TRINITY_DN2170_c0_g1_i2.p1  ORF type:complete len:245 (+),score=22.51 TRINITY_DN2170_c0_g1_i2:668-1402(+)
MEDDHSSSKSDSRSSLEELRDSYTVPENEFRIGNPIQIIYCCWRELIGEFLGSLLLVFFGTSSVVVLSGGGFSVVGVAFAFGFVVATMVYALSSISHAHVNPIVTLGVMIMLNVSMFKGALYIGAQIVGAIVGSAIVMAVVPEELGKFSNYGATTLATNMTLSNGEQWSVSIAQGFGIETVLTFYFVFTVFATSKMSPNDPVSVGKLAPLAIGFAVFVCHVIGVPLTGCSINPGKSLHILSNLS